MRSGKQVLAIIVCAFGMLAFAASATAQCANQSCGCSVLLTANDLGIDLGAPVPPTACLVNQNNVAGEGGLSVYRICLSKCPGGPKQACPFCAGHPILLADGQVFITQTDVRIPGLGGGLSLVRTWNSLPPGGVFGAERFISLDDGGSSDNVGVKVGGSSGPTIPSNLFGAGWTSTYEERIVIADDGYIHYQKADGSLLIFGADGSAYSVASPANVKATLTSGTVWTLKLHNGEQRIFDRTTGQLTKIIDRNGNTTQLAYDSQYRLITVTDPAARHLNFTYDTTAVDRVVGVSSDVGLSLTYSYDDSGRLSKITKPDQTTVSFEYAPAPANSLGPSLLISAVKDNDGKVLESHTYDSNGRGLSSSRANGVESITLSYPAPPAANPTPGKTVQ